MESNATSVFLVFVVSQLLALKARSPSQEDLEGLCQDVHFWQKEALVTLHDPKPARLGGGVAIVCVFANIALLLLLLLHAARVASPAVVFDGIVRVSVKMQIAAFFVGVRATCKSLLIFASGAEVLSWSESSSGRQPYT